jgi:hypothetical protein
MYEPLVTYLVSSPFGDVPVAEDAMHLPLECDPLKTPYRVYFHTIKKFIAHDSRSPLLEAAGKRYGEVINPDEIGEIIIRAEKHGALYHPASIELIFEKNRVKFGLNVALTETGRDLLKKEFEVIKKINDKWNFPYLPEVFFFSEQEAISFLLEEWFEGYHEFHLSRTSNGEQSLKLWEFGKGERYLSPEQSSEIYRQASKILTLYYDLKDFSQIYPWHHAAGDFIAKADGNGIDIRLTTARQYDPYMVFHETDQLNPVIALFYFLLNLTLRMRLDKLDGVGDTVWAADFCLEASIQGFLEGLGLKEELKDHFNSGKEFLNMLKPFSPEDYKTAFNPLIDLYKETGDYPVIIENLDRHVETLHAILRNYPA